MKIKALSSILCLITILGSLVSCTSTPVEQVVLNKQEVTIKEEETFSFTCTVLPSDASDKTVSWSSSDTSVAIVDSNGTITGLNEGTCMITAYADGKSAFANITVNKKAPDFKNLYDGLSSKYGWEVGSDGSYLSADTNVYDLEDYFNSSIWDAIEDMNEELGLPASLTNDMLQTTWSMGRQNEIFTSIGIEVTWTYHPDKGIEVTYKLLDN